jgi:hypothetical protein
MITSKYARAMQWEEKGYQILMVNSEDRSAPVSEILKTSIY